MKRNPSGFYQFTIDTKERTDFRNITTRVMNILTESGIKEGLCTVYVPHTTSGITINEAADPAVAQDISRSLDKLVPWKDGYAHGEGNSAAHIKASLMGSSVTIPVRHGRLALGTWQGIFYTEFDGPRQRTVMVQFSEHLGPGSV